MKINFLLLLTFIFLIGCKKDKGSDQTVKYLSKDLKDYAYFKKGTWWVYKEDSSQAIDSIVVYNNMDTILIFDGSTGTPEGKYESVECRAHSFYDEYNYYYYANTTWPGLEGKQYVFRDKTKPGDFAGATIAMFDNFVLNYQLPTLSQNGFVKLVEISDSLILINHTFYDVKKFYCSVNSTENDGETNFYFVRNLGIIRKELLSKNETWNLVKYHIIQ